MPIQLNYLSNFLSFGVHKNHTIQDKKSIYILNILFLVAFLAIFIFAVIELFNQRLTTFITHIFSLFATIIGWYFVWKGKYKTGLGILVSELSIALFFLSNYYGRDTANYTGFYQLIIGVWLIFNFKNLKELIFFTSLPIISLLCLEIFDYPFHVPGVLSNAEILFFHRVNIISFIITTIIFIILSYQNNQYFEKQIKTNEAIAKNILDSIPDLIWIVDEDFKMVSFNNKVEKGVEKLFGFKPQVGDDIRLWAQSSKFDINEWIDNYKKAFKGESFEVELEVENRVLNYVFTKCKLDENRQGVIVQGFDISKVKKEKQQLNNAKLLIETINRNIAEGIYRSTPKDGLIYANEPFARMFGYESIEDVLSVESPFLYVNPERRDELVEKINAQGFFSNEEVVFKRRNGEIFYALVSSFKSVDAEGNDFFDGSVRDISKIKLTEERLKSTNQLLESINQNIGEGIYRTAKDEGLIYVNKPFIKIFGYDSFEEMKKLSANELYKDIKRRDQLTDILEKEGRYVNEEVTYLKKDGSVFYAITSSSKTIDENGKVFYDGSIRDITILKVAEEALIKAKNEAEFAGKAKSLFLSNMSHEIRTPLNAIIGLTNQIIENKPEKIEDLENLNAIKYSSFNLLNIVNDILDFSKIDAGKIVLKNERFNFIEFFRQFKISVDTLAKDKNLEIIYDIDDNIPEFLKGDQYRLNQILLNLASNAVKYTETGSVKFIFKVFERCDKRLKIKFDVVDTGIGIPEDKLEFIFNPFTQIDLQNRYKHAGTGLGLTITKRLIELQDGSINLKSELNVGSTFSFKLAFDVVENVGLNEESELKETQPVEKDLSAFKILMVEDNKINVLLNQQIFKKWKCRLHEAYDGKQGIEKLNEEKFDFVLMDLQMPIMDGFQAFEIIKNYPPDHINYNIPVMAFTADAMEETKNRIIEIGFYDHLTKPFKEEDLFDKINKILIEKRNRL